MAGAWDQGSWGDNAWGTSNNVINATAQVLTVSTGTVEAYNLKGYCLGNAGKYEEAIKNFKTAIEIK